MKSSSHSIGESGRVSNRPGLVLPSATVSTSASLRTIAGSLMSDEGRRVVLLADRITNPDRAGTVRAVVERLETHGYRASLLCETASDAIRRAVPVVECHGLTDRWRLPWTSRQVRLDALMPRPDLIHVLQTRMAPAGLELAERWGVPYLQSIDEFLAEGSKLRLSRRWSSLDHRHQPRAGARPGHELRHPGRPGPRGPSRSLPRRPDGPTRPRPVPRGRDRRAARTGLGFSRPSSMPRDVCLMPGSMPSLSSSARAARRANSADARIDSGSPTG